MTGLAKKRIALAASLVLLPLVGCGALFYALRTCGDYHYRAAQEALEKRDFEQASIHLQKCLRIGFGNVDTHLQVVQTERRRGNFEVADQKLLACERRFGPNTELNLERRLLSIHRGDLVDADQLLSSFTARPQLRETPWVLESYIEGSLKALLISYKLERVIEGSESADQAERTLKAIELWLELRPNRADQVQGLIWRFQAHAFEHDVSKAWIDIRKAVELDPNHQEARFQLAMYLTQETPAESAVHLELLHERDPEDHRVCLALADVYRRLGQLSESKEMLEKLLAANPDNVPALIERGRIALDFQQPADAEHWFRCAYQLSPRSLEANLSLTRCLRVLGKDKEAQFFQEVFDQLVAETQRPGNEMKPSQEPATD